MKYFAIILLVMFLGLHHMEAQPINFGDSTIVSLITCEPGDQVYAKFGHTAIRIRDNQGLDLIYNYGLFDFKTDNFLLKFVKGHTDYLLGVSYTENFLNEYRERNSTVWEQVLNLDKKEKQTLINLLAVNYEPQNRMYRYNFVFDNCSTRPQDIIQKSIKGIIIDEKTPTDDTYREIISSFLEDDAWTDLGINLIFGADADRIAGDQGKVFIPGNLKSYFQRAKVLPIKGKGVERPLVSKLNVLVQSENRQVSPTPWYFHPLTFSLLLFVFGFILTLIRQKNARTIYRMFDTLLFLITGLVGLFILIFSMFSVHPLVANNLDILWLNPLNLMVAFLIWNSRTKKFLFYYYILYLVMMAIYAVVTVFFVHTVIPALVPLLTLMVIRTLRREQRLLHFLFKPTFDGLKWKG